VNLSLTSTLAIYGAALSTLTAVIQLITHLRDRAKVVLKIRKDMKALGLGPAYAGMTMAIVTATNVGRRPVTMHGFAMCPLFKKGEPGANFFLRDVRPPLPFEITEGKDVSAFVEQATVDFSSISHWFAWDSTGRHYYLNVAPWYKRWVSEYRYRHN
jgi:hypothetical protein